MSKLMEDIKEEDRLEKKIDELAELIDSLQWQVTELRLSLTDKTRGAERLSRIVGVDIPRPLTELERLTAELVEDLHDRGMTDEEIKKEYFTDGRGGAVSLFQGVEEAKKSDSPYKQTLLHFDEALDGMMVKDLVGRDTGASDYAALMEDNQ